MTQPTADSIGRIAIINLQSIADKMTGVAPCQDCAGGLQVEVFRDGVWRVAPAHSTPCVFVVRRERLLHERLPNGWPDAREAG